MELPLVERALVLKQISLDDLSDLGRAALSHAFTGFSADFASEQVEAHLEEMRSVTGVPSHVFDPNPYRRFAGDALLPRGRYHTIPTDESGQDGGTLVRELRSYYNPRHAGIIQVFDSTAVRDRQVLGRLPANVQFGHRLSARSQSGEHVHKALDNRSQANARVFGCGSNKGA